MQEKTCEHDWKPTQADLGDVPNLGAREEVRCQKCGVFGERYIKTEEVFWPTS